VTDGAAVAKMVQACVDKFGRIDVLVNNVGGSAAGGPVEMSEEVWDAQIDHNLKSVFLTCKYVLPIMEKQKSGAIVNMASTSGPAFHRRLPGRLCRHQGRRHSARPRNRRAICGQGHSCEHGRAGANCTRRWSRHAWPSSAPAATSRRYWRNVRKRIPLGFMGDGRDTANAALFLASDEARFITGTEIVVDGGMTVRCD